MTFSWCGQMLQISPYLCGPSAQPLPHLLLHSRSQLCCHLIQRQLSCPPGRMQQNSPNLCDPLAQPLPHLLLHSRSWLSCLLIQKQASVFWQKSHGASCELAQARTSLKSPKAMSKKSYVPFFKRFSPFLVSWDQKGEKMKKLKRWKKESPFQWLFLKISCPFLAFFFLMSFQKFPKQTYGKVHYKYINSER